LGPRNIRVVGAVVSIFICTPSERSEVLPTRSFASAVNVCTPSAGTNGSV
jgi:hypothetical protein